MLCLCDVCVSVMCLCCVCVCDAVGEWIGSSGQGTGHGQCSGPLSGSCTRHHADHKGDTHPHHSFCFTLQLPTDILQSFMPKLP